MIKENYGIKFPALRTEITSRKSPKINNNLRNKSNDNIDNNLNTNDSNNKSYKVKINNVV